MTTEVEVMVETKKPVLRPWGEVVFGKPVVLAIVVFGFFALFLVTNLIASPFFAIVGFVVALLGSLAYFSSERWVQSKNPAGLGATNDGAWGNTFASIAEAIFAQYAHLMAYALPSNPTPLQKAIASADPRYAALVKKNWVGSAPRWQDLNGKWAYPGVGYGESIVVLGSTFRQ